MRSSGGGDGDRNPDEFLAAGDVDLVVGALFANDLSKKPSPRINSRPMIPREPIIADAEVSNRAVQFD